MSTAKVSNTRTTDRVITTILIAVLVGLFGTAMYFIFTAPEVSNSDRRIAVCEYLGGKVHDDLCIKDNAVISTEKK